MRTIYKYPLVLTERQILRLPEDAVLLSVQMQGSVITIWALIETDWTMEDAEIRIVGTGMPFEDAHQYTFLGTVQMHGYVWHVFYKVAR